ncbi:MAG: chemotaxis response regulator protein-glutamate methylesterase [Bdellovibrionaceae bacterium]|nr:chemotaxis response regulator protein-glutamate methylesterase [Pseudobdellovibrionaceae bacterium]NUM58749.1 chemotaxis response regulator protein-glutamate methylesterase [Pseudobdellovibrionaceae bacterium]
MNSKFKFEVFQGLAVETIHLKMHQSLFFYFEAAQKKSLLTLLHDMSLNSFKDMLAEVKSKLNCNEVDLSLKMIGPKKPLEEIAAFVKTQNMKLLNQVIRENDFEVYYTQNGNKLILSKENSSIEVTPQEKDKLENKIIKVMIVDDSATIIQLLSMIFKKDKNIQVVATCENPLEAEGLYKTHKPDVITMDIHMPHIDGVQLVKKLAPTYKVPIVMISSISQEEGPQVFNALEGGAVDYIQKPTLKELDLVAPLIIERVKNASLVSVETKLRTTFPSRNLVKKNTSYNLDAQSIVVIGSSTGGTEALKSVFLTLPKETPPILVVQHIPPVFSTAFAKRLNDILPHDVFEAKDGDEVKKNTIYIAPGGKQMAIKKAGNVSKIVITDDEPVNRHKPSVDYFFQSVAKQDYHKIVGVILTGMGADGARELLNLRKLGARTIAQNKETCVVYGMPREAVERGAAEFVLPLENIGDKIMELASASDERKKSAS